MSIIYNSETGIVTVDVPESMRDILTTVSAMDPTKAGLTGDVGWITDIQIVTANTGSVLIDSTLELTYKCGVRSLIPEDIAEAVWNYTRDKLEMVDDLEMSDDVEML